MHSVVSTSPSRTETPLGSTSPRYQAGLLLDAVIDELMTPAMALTRWPDSPDDLSLAVAYQALWHFEADEDHQRTELFYLDAQLELLRQMSRYLLANRELPAYMLTLYPKERQVHYLAATGPWETIRRSLRQTWQKAAGLLQQSLALALGKRLP